MLENTIQPLAPKNIQEAQQVIREIRKKRDALSNTISLTETNLKELEEKYVRKKSGFLNKIFASKQTIDNLEFDIEVSKKEISKLYSELDQFQVDINNLNVDIDEVYYKNLIDTFEKVRKCDKIWKITSQKNVTEAKSSASENVERKVVNFLTKDLPFIKSKFKALVLNIDDQPIFIYPTFLLLFINTEIVQVIDLKNLSFSFKPQRFLERKETIPPDTKIVDQTWLKVNKDGTPDRRFVGNFQIPVVRYGSFHFSVPGSIDITYYLSNYELSETFANLFQKSNNPAFKSPIFSKPLELPKNQNYLLTRKFYDLLVSFSSELTKVSNKIMQDKVLNRKFKESSNVNLPEEFIRNCIVFDLSKIVKILIIYKDIKNELELTGLVYCVSRILSLGTDELIGKDYENLAISHSEGKYKDISKVLIDLANGSNPIIIDQDLLENRGVSFDEYLKNGLAFPTYLKLIEHNFFDEYAAMLYHFANIIAKADNQITSVETIKLNQIYQITHHPIPETFKKTAVIEHQSESINDIIKELDSLIGLDGVKQEIKTLINFINIQKARQASGLKSSNISYHIVFTGNPGTGKTTVARIVAKVYKTLGILSKGQLVETDRSGLIAEYVGQTAPRVNKIVDSALNGILFIDEAYSIAGETQNDFGKEAIATLIKRMEDDRDKLVVIVAGYPKEMNVFIETNPGLKSRFNRYVDFPDYTPSELFSIYESKCNGLEYKITDEAKSILNTVFESAYNGRDRSFGNGRFVRNIFEKTLERQANRIAGITSLSREILTTITENDIPR